MAISDGKSLEFISDEEKGKERVEEEEEEEEDDKPCKENFWNEMKMSMRKSLKSKEGEKEAMQEEEEEKDARGWLGLLEISKNCCLNLDDEK